MRERKNNNFFPFTKEIVTQRLHDFGICLDGPHNKVK